MRKSLYFLLALVLGGCSSLSDQVEGPKTAILAEFSKAIDLQEGVPLRIEMDSITPECWEKGNQLVIDFRLRMTAFRPVAHANESLKSRASYFVAVIDNDTDKVLSRTDHELTFTFAENQSTKVMFENMREEVPAHKNLSLYVGFNLDQKQLDFFKQEREKKMRGH